MISFYDIYYSQVTQTDNTRKLLVDFVRAASELDIGHANASHDKMIALVIT